jgi:hypothetical protein
VSVCGDISALRDSPKISSLEQWDFFFPARDRHAP